MHKVQRPDLLDGLRHCQDLRFVTRQALSGFDAQIQRQFALYAVNPFVAPSELLHVAQVQLKQAKAPAAVVVRKADQQVGNLLVLGVKLGLVGRAGLTVGEY